jgi:hypothetical protein
MYRVRHRFGLTKRDDYFWVSFDHFWIERYFLGKWVMVKSVSSHEQVSLVQICETRFRNLTVEVDDICILGKSGGCFFVQNNLILTLSGKKTMRNLFSPIGIVDILFPPPRLRESLWLEWFEGSSTRPNWQKGKNK